MNRVTAAIAKAEKNISERLAKGIVTQAKVDEYQKTLDMPMDEYVSFQQIKSLASMDGTLTLEEAQTIYGYLGETPDTFNKQPLAVKSVLSQIYAELLKKQIKAKRR